MLFSNGIAADILERDEVRRFIDRMADRHAFETEQLENLFQDVRISESVLEAIARPAEALPWYKYRPIFIRPDRVRLGVEFMEKNRAILQRAEEDYGVPEEIITAVIGVETRYGNHKGGYRVIDSLSTLAFYYPKRSDFFRSELEQFLLLAREQELDPQAVMGSYAGAMGIPQFISSSYRNYAVDYDEDGRIDIWANPADAIGSVGNYFRLHGWARGEQVAIPAMVKGKRYTEIVDDGLKPHISVQELPRFDVYPVRAVPGDERVKLLELELGKGSEFWLGLHNFYVITRYNHSALYAMAVYQLSRAIREKYQAKLADK